LQHPKPAISASPGKRHDEVRANSPRLIPHSRRTLAVIRQNIAFALTVKGVFVVLTFLGSASLWSAIAADMGASLLVTSMHCDYSNDREPCACASLN
jgi:cation transport ATPase